jgi:hypothetical protein
MSVGFEIAVEDEDGSMIASIQDPTNILHRVLPAATDDDYRYLNVIDWYGDAIFNGLQIEGFRRELARITGAVGLPEERDLLAQLDKLAVLVQSEPHLYLKFYGD